MSQLQQYPDFSDLIDRLTYINYACNRDTHPHVPASKWAEIFPNGRVYEARYQSEKALAKANAYADAMIRAEKVNAYADRPDVDESPNGGRLKPGE